MRYLAGAVLCVAVNNVALFSNEAMGGSLARGVLLSWISGGLTGYLWHALITYRKPISFRGCAKFLAGALLGIPLAWLTLWILTVLLMVPILLAGPVTSLAMFGYHYTNTLVALRLYRRRSAATHLVG